MIHDTLLPFSLIQWLIVTRAERLLKLMQLLRQYRYPVSGKVLAEQLEISLRTLYRDIASLKAQGAEIDGETGMGYVLNPGFLLPPLMFSDEEIEAIVLGSRWVAQKADSDLKQAAQSALAKISDVLPLELRRQLEFSGLMIGPGEVVATSDAVLSEIRRAIRKEYKLDISYSDNEGKASQRLIWPIGLGFFDQVRIVIAWCELRQALRHFRTDRITSLAVTPKCYPTSRQALYNEWRQMRGKY